MAFRLRMGIQMTLVLAEGITFYDLEEELELLRTIVPNDPSRLN